MLKTSLNWSNGKYQIKLEFQSPHEPKWNILTPMYCINSINPEVETVDFERDSLVEIANGVEAFVKRILETALVYQTERERSSKTEAKEVTF